MWDAMRDAISASMCVHFHEPSEQPLTFKEAFYLATVGGADALAMADQIGRLRRRRRRRSPHSPAAAGSISVGKQFDALVLDAHAPGSPVDVFDGQSRDDAFSKLFYGADDRNVVRVYVAGRLVLPRAAAGPQ